MKRLLQSLFISVALVSASIVGAVPMISPSYVSAASGDCDDNAVVRCGVFSTAALQENYKGDVKAAYNYFGITDGMISGTSATIKNGYVSKSGNVTVNGTVIATNAMSAGRQNMTGSTAFTAGGTTFYKRSTSVSFVSDNLAAYVMVDKDGNFLGAVIKSCGNPVSAQPKVVKTPAAACSSLTVQKISRSEFTFGATASVKDGATISGFTFNINGPSTNKNISLTTIATSATTSTVVLDKPGTYTASVTVKTSVGNKTDTTLCQKEFVVENEVVVTPTKTSVCNPANGQTITVDESDASKYKPVGDAACQPKVESAAVEKIASTGPADILGGVAGLGSLTAAGYYLRASRSRLISVIKK